MDEYSYSYDGAHNQTSKTEIINGKEKGTTSYSYDKLNRLIKIQEPIKETETAGRITSYTYDAAGNRETERTTTSKAAATKTTLITYKYNEQNRLMSATEETGDGTKKTTTYTYDGNGNMTRKSMEQTRQIDPSNAPKARFGIYIEGQAEGATKNAKPIVSAIASYEYNVWNQLKKATTAEGISTYKYNGEGYRTEKTENGKTTISLYEADKVILEADANGKEIARNLYGTNLITRTVTETENSTTQKTSYNYLYNGHGDVTALLTQDGTIAASYYYDAFGTAVETHYYNASGEETDKAVNNPYRYAGYVFDSTTDLYYLNARYYDSKIARFMSEDTYTGEINDPLSLNLYTYCHNNPIKYVDPTGHAVAKVGTRGDTVQAIQEKLNKLGYNVGKADGVFGEQTKAAVIKFQKDNGLTVDGIVGNQTLTELYFEQSKQKAKANGITLPEAQKAKVGQLSGNVSIMTDAKFNQAMAKIAETKAKTNGGSLNTDVKNNEIVVTKVNIGTTTPTSAPVTVTPKTPVPAASSSQMSSLTNNVTSISSAISASNVATINASKSTNSVSNGTGNDITALKAIVLACSYNTMSATDRIESLIDIGKGSNNTLVKAAVAPVIIINEPQKMAETIQAAVQFQLNIGTNYKDPELSQAFASVFTAYVAGKVFEGMKLPSKETVSTIRTPYGNAVQSTSKEALQLRQSIDNGGQLYRGGTFGRSNVTDAQFWAAESPLNPGYANKYGVDFNKIDYIIGGKQISGSPYITRPAPSLGNNSGGGLEIVNNPNSVRLDFFYMP